MARSRLSDPQTATAPVSAHIVGPFALGERVGDLVLRSVLGEGGMGTVFEALDTRLQRSVAVKVPRDGALAAAAPDRPQPAGQLAPLVLNAGETT